MTVFLTFLLRFYRKYFIASAVNTNYIEAQESFGKNLMFLFSHLTGHGGDNQPKFFNEK